MIEVIETQRGPKNGRTPSRRRRFADGSRRWWYAAYEQLRAIAREHRKAMVDVMTFGSGYVRTDTRTGDVEYIPWRELQWKDEVAQLSYTLVKHHGAQHRVPR